MLKSEIEQLKALLGRMGSPNPNEYRTILTEFNKYKSSNEPVTEEPVMEHFGLVFLMAEKFIYFELMRQIRDKSINKFVVNAAGAVAQGYFYEIVSTIYKHDIFGWHYSGFDITEKELAIFAGSRNTNFHVPDDLKLFESRIKNMQSLKANERLVQITLNNSGSLVKYFNWKRRFYPYLDDYIESAFKPTRDPNFLKENFR